MTDRMEFYVPGQPFDGGTYHYVESGLENVFLKNGFSIEEDPEYGTLVTFHNAEDLNNAIGLHIASAPKPLSPKEFKFLRKQMRATQAALGKSFGVSEQTIANYEKGETPIPKTTDELLCLTFVIDLMPDDSRASFLKDLFESRNTSKKSKRAKDRAKIIKSWCETDQSLNGSETAAVVGAGC